MAIAFHSTFGILLTHQFRISKKLWRYNAVLQNRIEFNKINVSCYTNNLYFNYAFNIIWYQYVTLNMTFFKAGARTDVYVTLNMSFFRAGSRTNVLLPHMYTLQMSFTFTPLHK